MQRTGEREQIHLQNLLSIFYFQILGGICLWENVDRRSSFFRSRTFVVVPVVFQAFPYPS